MFVESKGSSFRVYDEVGGGVALYKSVLITVTEEIDDTTVQRHLRGVTDKRRLYQSVHEHHQPINLTMNLVIEMYSMS